MPLLLSESVALEIGYRQRPHAVPPPVEPGVDVGQFPDAIASLLGDGEGDLHRQVRQLAGIELERRQG